MAIESVSWILTVFGFASRYLNTGSKALTYLSAAAYPVYILHMVFLYLGSYILFGLELSAITKFFVLIAFTGLGCFVTYELIRRISFLRLLFGLKNQKKRTFGKEMNYGKVEPMPIGLSSQEK